MRREVVVDEVVGHEERRVAERFGLPRLLGQLLAGGAFGRDNTESKIAIAHVSDPIRSSPSYSGRVGRVEVGHFVPLEVSNRWITSSRCDHHG